MLACCAYITHSWSLLCCAFLAEAENKSATDAAQWTIQENRANLASLKSENKELKLELARRGGTAALGGGLGAGSGTGGRDAGKSAVDKTIEKLEKEVHDLRRQYDKLMQVRNLPCFLLQYHGSTHPARPHARLRHGVDVDSMMLWHVQH